MRIRYSRYILNLFFVTVFLTLCSLVFAMSVYADDGSGSTKTNPDENAYISGGNINEKGNNDAQVDESVLTNPDVLKSGESVSPENNEQINNQTLSSPSGVPEKIEKAADGKLYYIDSTGKRKTSAGWIYFDGKKYFASPGGSLYTNQMITFGSYGYYMGSDGSVVLGHFRGADGVYRYADAIGELEDESYGKLAAVGWREDKYFAYGGYGKLYHNEFISFGEVRYYMNTDGSVVKTEFNYGNKRYMPDPVTGKIKSGKAGWVIDKAKNTKKFAKGDGTIYFNDMITFGSYGYYMGSDGSVVLGHFRGADGVYRYADAIGELEDESYGKLAAVGWREDKYFAYGGYGKLYHNEFITFGDKIYYMNTDGSIVKTPFRYRWANITPNPTTGLISRADYNRAVNTGPYPYQRYALVNLSQQYVQLWVDGRMIYSTLVVTGKPSTPTPRGTFSLLYKTTNTYLTGPGYHLHVNYWMPFTHQGHGLHDAYWLRSSQFGGNTYLSGWGSHGCVNMPNSAAQTFYRYLSAGDRVIII